MQDQYSRTQLLLGKEAMEKLHNSRVAVFGIGGVGGYTVEALARSGVLLHLSATVTHSGLLQKFKVTFHIGKLFREYIYHGFF